MTGEQLPFFGERSNRVSKVRSGLERDFGCIALEHKRVTKGAQVIVFSRRARMCGVWAGDRFGVQSCHINFSQWELSTMKAIRVYEAGGPEVFRYEDVPAPQPGPGEARV